ncbi:MAG: BrnT family toxin [Terriglobia bacterium]
MHAIGAVSAALLLVVHVYREDEVDGEEIIRIISAREANQRERRIYIQQAAE